MDPVQWRNGSTGGAAGEFSVTRTLVPKLMLEQRPQRSARASLKGPAAQVPSPAQTLRSVCPLLHLFGGFSISPLGQKPNESTEADRTVFYFTLWRFVWLRRRITGRPTGPSSTSRGSSRSSSQPSRSWRCSGTCPSASGGLLGRFGLPGGHR